MSSEPALVVLENANVVDVVAGNIIADRTVAIKGERIVGIDDRRRSNQKAEHRIDLRGHFLLPGLIDCHCHPLQVSSDLAGQTVESPQYVMARAYEILKGMLLRGFTTIRDCGGADFGFARAVQEGIVTGPRIVYGGKALTQTGGHGDFRAAGQYFEDPSYWVVRISRRVDGVDEVRRAARDEIRKGAHHIKIMANGGIASPTDRITSDQFSEEEIAAVVEEAKMANIYVCAHTYTSRSIERAVRNGVRSVEHCNLADDETLQFIKANGAFMVPTLIIFKALAEEGVEDGLPPELAEKIGGNLEAGIDAVERAHRLGVPMAFGSDLIGAMHRRQLEEFELRADVVPAVDLVRSATITAAKLLKMEKDIGQISVGFKADMIAVESNPLEDIHVLADPDKNLKLIVQRGRVLLDRVH